MQCAATLLRLARASRPDGGGGRGHLHDPARLTVTTAVTFRHGSVLAAGLAESRCQWSEAKALLAPYCTLSHFSMTASRGALGLHRVPFTARNTSALAAHADKVHDPCPRQMCSHLSLRGSRGNVLRYHLKNQRDEDGAALGRVRGVEPPPRHQHALRDEFIGPWCSVDGVPLYSTS